jgi:hypothetical protein
MTKSLSCSAVVSLVLALILTCATAQVEAALEGPKPSVSVDVFGPTGFSTFKADKVNRHFYSAVWEIPAGIPSGNADLYFGMLTPDKIAYTWLRQGGSYVLTKGMHPVRAGVSLASAATLNIAQMDGLGEPIYIATDVPSGMYFVFAMVVRAGTTPGDPSNWMAVEMKPLVIE